MYQSNYDQFAYDLLTLNSYLTIQTYWEEIHEVYLLLEELTCFSNNFSGIKVLLTLAI